MTTYGTIASSSRVVWEELAHINWSMGLVALWTSIAFTTEIINDVMTLQTSDYPTVKLIEVITKSVTIVQSLRFVWLHIHTTPRSVEIPEESVNQRVERIGHCIDSGFNTIIDILDTRLPPGQN